MVVFKRDKSGKKEYLVTLNCDDDKIEDGVRHVVIRPAVGLFAEKHQPFYFPFNLDKWWTEHAIDSSSKTTSKLILRSSHHCDADTMPSFSLLRDRIAAKGARWSNILYFGSDFSYISHYWEWCEDIIRNCRGSLQTVHLLHAVYASMFLYRRNSHLVESLCELWCPETNTLITSVGEVSISLWDIRSITGLPITGGFYDEVVPCVSELLESGNDGKRYLPPSCKHLFSAYHKIFSNLIKKNKVSFEDWCGFWFKGQSKYSSKCHPFFKEDFASYGDPQPWDDETHRVFALLEIPENERRQTYLAAFLSCWLCAFVLPVRDLGNIRPSVFKVASMLASGEKISLAIPVLTSIYRGLKDISNSNYPGKAKGYFAAHYVYAWIASYYQSKRAIDFDYDGATMISYRGTESIFPLQGSDAKALIPLSDRFTWHATFIANTENEVYDDHIHNPRHITEAFVAMRSSFLTLRHEDNHIVEPYSPHRFGRQFGFCQDQPGQLESDIRSGTRVYMLQLFESTLRLGTKSKFVIPQCDSEVGLRVTSNYSTWWKQISSQIFSNASNIRRSPDAPTDKDSTKTKKRKSESRVTPDSPVTSTDTSRKRLLIVKLSTGTTQGSETKKPSPPRGNAKLAENNRAKAVEVVSSSERPPRSVCSGENILDILDDVSELIESGEEMGSKSDVDIGIELAASVRGVDDVSTVDQDLIEAANDPVILGVTYCLQEAEARSAEHVKAVPFDAQSMILQAERQAALSVADMTRVKLLKSTPDDLLGYQKEFEELFKYLSTKIVNASDLKACVENFVDSALQLRPVQKDPVNKLPLSHYEDKIQAIEAKLATAASLEKQAVTNARAVRDDMEATMSKIEKLKTELTELEAKETQLAASLVVEETRCSKHTSDVKNLSEEHSSLLDAFVAAKGETEKLQDATKTFFEAEAALRDLKLSV